MRTIAQSQPFVPPPASVILPSAAHPRERGVLIGLEPQQATPEPGEVSTLPAYISSTVSIRSGSRALLGLAYKLQTTY
jgi:hypothetical protein